MHCNAWNHLYLRANGEFNCYCGPGESYVIFKDTPLSTAPVNIVDNVINGAYVGIRQKLSDDRIPFPDTCPQCGFFSENPFRGSLYTDRVDTFQVEPSFRCALDCSICVPRHLRSRIPGPRDLPFDYFEKVVENISLRGIRVDNVGFCGKGEPLLNPETPHMVGRVAELMHARTSVTTSGNIDWDDEIVLCGVDTLVFSIDGATASSYRKYRDGDWNLAVNNLERACRLARSDQQVIWKYILFSHNDTTDELKTAKSLSERIGATLQFDFTNAPNPSLRFRSPEDLTRFWENPEAYPDPPAPPPIAYNQLEAIRAVHGKIYIYGAGAVGIQARRYLERNGVSIAGWIDSASYKQGGRVDGLPVYPPHGWEDREAAGVIIGSRSNIKSIRAAIPPEIEAVFEITPPEVSGI